MSEETEKQEARRRRFNDRAVAICPKLADRNEYFDLSGHHVVLDGQFTLEEIKAICQAFELAMETA